MEDDEELYPQEKAPLNLVKTGNTGILNPKLNQIDPKNSVPDVTETDSMI